MSSLILRKNRTAFWGVSLKLKIVTHYNIPSWLFEVHSLGDTWGKSIASLQSDTESQLSLCSKLSDSHTGCSGLLLAWFPMAPYMALTLVGFPGGKESICQCRKHNERQVRSLGQEDPLEESLATHSSILDWKIPWMEEPGGPPSMGSQRVRHDWAHTHTYTY